MKISIPSQIIYQVNLNEDKRIKGIQDGPEEEKETEALRGYVPEFKSLER